MAHKKADFSTTFMQSLVDQDPKVTVELMQSAKDADVRKLLTTFVEVTKMIAKYAMQRGIPIDDTNFVVVVEADPDAEKN